MPGRRHPRLAWQLGRERRLHQQACSVHAIEGSYPAHISIPARGTSFAAPMTSGAAALVIASKPHLKGRPQQVKALLASSADDLGKAGTDILFSRGRLNTLRAVQ